MMNFLCNGLDLKLMIDLSYFYISLQLSLSNLYFFSPDPLKIVSFCQYCCFSFGHIYKQVFRCLHEIAYGYSHYKIAALTVVGLNSSFYFTSFLEYLQLIFMYNKIRVQVNYIIFKNQALDFKAIGLGLLSDSTILSPQEYI